MKIDKCEQIIKNIVFDLSSKGFLNFIPDDKMIRLLYRLNFHRAIDLKNPITFNEKIQWLKLYDRNPIYTTFADKYAVREYIKENIGEEYLVPLIGGPWKNVDEIPFDILPNQFVLKTTHDSGGVVVCRNKDNFDIVMAKKKLNTSLKHNFYYGGREWAYKGVPPQIIAERYLEDFGTEKKELVDYKFFCFNGEVKFLYVSQGLENHETANISFVSLEWEPESFKRKDYKAFEQLPDRPVKFDEMISIAKKLSHDYPFMRVDLYEVEKHVFFSEITLYPNNGFLPFEPEEYDRVIGEMIKLPDRIVKG